MREIIFRGQNIEGMPIYEWHYGYLIKERFQDKIYIGDKSLMSRVDPDTVGEYTGIKDKYGEKIFEGDIVRLPDGEIGEVKCDEDTARFIMCCDGYICDFDNCWGYEIEILGNVYDNPELIRGGDEDE